MNNLDKDIAEAIGEISKVATLINIQGKHQVFIRISGHVNEIGIDFHKNGWENHKDPTLSQQIDLECDDALDALKKVRDTFYKFLKNGQVSMEDRSYEVEEIKHYKFY